MGSYEHRICFTKLSDAISCQMRVIHLCNFVTEEQTAGGFVCTIYEHPIAVSVRTVRLQI